MISAQFVYRNLCRAIASEFNKGPVNKIDNNIHDKVALFTAGLFHRSRVTGHRSRVTGHRSRVTGHGSRVTGHGSQVTGRGSRVTDLLVRQHPLCGVYRYNRVCLGYIYLVLDRRLCRHVAIVGARSRVRVASKLLVFWGEINTNGHTVKCLA